MFECIEKDKQDTILVQKLTKEIKQSVKDKKMLHLEFSFDKLCFDQTFYKSNKKETLAHQRFLAKRVIAVYKDAVRVIKYAKFHKIQFSKTIYISGLKNKRNNNDKMLCFMLSTRFEHNYFSRLNFALRYGCDFIDNEITENNMCDFVDNVCVLRRRQGYKNISSCCPKTCKFTNSCPCKTKNISCKFIFCEYLEKQGKCINAFSLAILRVFLDPLEQVASMGMFFKSERHVARIVRFVGIFKYVIAFIILMQIVQLFI